MTPEQVSALAACLDRDGVVLFPTDTVYGLGCDPESRVAASRLNRLKGRDSGKPAAVMFFALGAALDAVPLGPRTQKAALALLPGPVMLVVPNRDRRFALACGGRHDALGIRVPRLEGALAPLFELGRPVLQSSANPAGGADPRRLEDVDPAIRSAADAVLDGGELPGTPSTVVDLVDFEARGAWRVLREGAVARDALERALSSVAA